MSGLLSLKLFVKQRLSAALDDVFQHVDKTITEFEHELLRRHRKLLDDAFTPETGKRRADVTDVQLLLDPPELQEWSSSLDQEEPPEPPHIKEEQEELWSSQEGEQLGGLEEVKEEDEAPPSHLHLSQTEPVTCSSAGADGADCTGPEPARNSDPDHYSAAVSEEKLLNSSEAETEVSDEEWKESRDTLDSVGLGHVPVSEDKYKPVKKSFTCCECGRTFGRKDSLRRHMRFHTGERPYSCSVCSKRFSQSPNLIRHMRCHSGERPFSCSFCDASFAVRSAQVNHMRIHTGEKPFSCLYCNKSFTQKGGLKKHVMVHTGEKPYSCPLCDKSFAQKANLTYHFSVHTGQKQFSCSVCDKRFTWKSQVKSHKCVGESSST